MATRIEKIRNLLKTKEKLEDELSKVEEKLSKLNGDLLYCSNGAILRTPYSYIFLWRENCSISKKKVEEVKRYLYRLPNIFRAKDLYATAPIDRTVVTRALWVLEAYNHVRRIDRHTYESVSPSVRWFRDMEKRKYVNIDGDGNVECKWKKGKMKVTECLKPCPYFYIQLDEKIICMY